MLHSLRIAPALLCLATSAAIADVGVKKLEDRVRVELDGKLFTELRYKDTPHICYWPIIGPGGTMMVRSFPMGEAPDEEHDHIHHRGLWFAHGLVDGIDYWSEPRPPGSRPSKHEIGVIQHDQVLKAEGGKDSGEVLSSQKWVAPDGSIPLTSTQRLVLYSTPDSERRFDFEVTVKAGNKAVTFQETKEGTSAIRIAESMRARQPKGKEAFGHILNSNGEKDKDVWGKEAKWVAMTGPIKDKPFTIAFFDHPQSFRHPTRWHARDYGLFAANPFGGNAMDKALPEGAGHHTLKPGETLTFKYRLVIRQSDADAKWINEAYQAYASGK